MTLAKSILLFAIISIAILVGYFIGQNTKTISAEAELQTIESPKIDKLLAEIKQARIKQLQIWDDGEFVGVVRQLEELVEKDHGLSSSQKFFLYDKSGKSVYELKDFVIEDFSFERLTRRDFQILIETNGGGTDNNLEIIDYKDGKFTEIIDSSETGIRGGFWAMPEYRSGVKTPYFKPSQIFVINQLGGADDNPTASVFRYKNDKFQKVGEFQMRDLGDFIEAQISKKR